MADYDQPIMEQLIAEAQNTLESKNYPIAAALVIDGELIEITSNRLIEDFNWVSHAESIVLRNHSSLIRERTRRLTDSPGVVELYTTLEPCLMCLGTALLHKVHRIVYACPDPRGGVVDEIKPEQLTQFYQDRWPIIEGGLMWEKSYELVTSYIAQQPESFWPAILQEFKDRYGEYSEKYK